MATSVTSIVLGLVLAAISIIALFVNVLVAIAIIYSKMMQSRNPVYIFSFATIVNDSLMIFLHLFYFAPSCFLQDYLFPESSVEDGRKVLDALLMISWYYGTLSHIVIAIDRFVTVLFYRYTIFTRKIVVFLVLIQIIASLGLSMMTQFIFPCCRLSFTYSVYTYTYLEISGIPNYSNMFDLPLNGTASVTPLIAYSSIAIMMYKASQNIGKRRAREYTFAIQFAVMALIYTLVWVCVRVMPMILSGTSNLYLYGITTCFTLFNTSTNAIVYLTNNKEIKQSLRSFTKKIRKKSVVMYDSTATPEVAVNHTTRNQSAGR